MSSITIGQILREARENRSLTLDQAAGDTHIRLLYLQSLEAGDFDALPSRFQVRGFLRLYANYLGLDVEQILALLDGKPIPQKETKPAEPLPEPEDEPLPESKPLPATPAVDKEEQQPPPGEAVAHPRFAEIGQKLHNQREVLGLSFNDVEQHTHLRAHYIKALETGDMDSLPSLVQGRGMLKNYAEFLGLNPDDLLSTFADELQAELIERRPETVQILPAKATASDKHKRGRLFGRDAIVAIILVISLLAFGIWGGLKVAELRDDKQTPVPPPPSIAEVLLPSPSATLPPTPTATTLAEIEAAAVTPNPDSPQETQSVALTPGIPVGPVRVEIVVRERAYLRVVVDGETVFDKRVLAGTVYTFSGEDVIEIITGSGSALDIAYNEQEIGVLGTYGEAVNFVVTVDGVQTPTPTITPTPTETPTPAITPTPNS